jgi:hypothetical protein
VFLLSAVILAALARLEHQNLLTPDSSIPNISLVVALFFRWFANVTDIEDREEDLQIIEMILEIMKKHDMAITGLHKMDFMEKLKLALDGISDDNKSKVNSENLSKDKFDFLGYVSFAHIL